MKTRELRANARISISERGWLNSGLNSGDAWFPCMILDMSDSGFMIFCSKLLTVGQLLDFKVALFPDKTLECKVEIKHIGEAGIGTKITEIDKKGSVLVQLYLQEQFSLKLNKSL